MSDTDSVAYWRKRAEDAERSSDGYRQEAADTASAAFAREQALRRSLLAKLDTAERELATLRDLVNAAARAGAPVIARSVDEQVRGEFPCPAGHGPMRYRIEDDKLHCHCGAVATTHGNIIVDPDPIEVKRG